MSKYNFCLVFPLRGFVWEEIKFMFKTKYLIYIYLGAIESLLTSFFEIVCSGLSITLCRPFILY